MAEKRFLPRKTSIACEYLPTNSNNPLNNPKIKIFQSHPSLPLLAYYDENQSIVVFDLQAKKIVWESSIVNLFDSFGSSTRKSDKINNSNNNIQRLSTYSNQKFLGKSANVGGLLPKNMFPSQTNISASNKDNKPFKEFFGEFKYLEFSDDVSLCYRRNILSSATSCLYFGATKANRLLLQFELGVVLVDYFLKQTQFISSMDLNGKKISSSTLLTPEILALACQDGQLRLWSIEQRKVLRSIAIQKSDLVLIKVFPYLSLQCEEHSFERVKVLVSTSDGIVCLWDVNLTNESFESSANSPSFDTLLFKLQDPIGPKIGYDSLSFDLDNKILYSCNAEHKLSLYDIQEIYSKADRRASLQRKPSFQTSKRNSFFGSKTSSTNALTSTNTAFDLDEQRVLHPYRSFKLAKQSPVYLNKISSWISLLVPGFVHDLFLVSSKTHSIGIFKNNDNHFQDEESEKSSTNTSNLKEKAIRLDVIEEISLFDCYMDYCNHNSTSNNSNNNNAIRSMDQLKVYSIQSLGLWPGRVIVSTSIGLFLIGFLNSSLYSSLQLPSNTSESLFKTMFVTENHAMKSLVLSSIETAPSSSSLVSFGDHFDNQSKSIRVGSFVFHCDQVTDISQEIARGFGPSLSSRNKDSRASIKTSTTNNQLLRMEKSLLRVSPSGRFLAIVSSLDMSFCLFDLKKDIAISPSAFPLGNHCMEFAWIGYDDKFLIKIHPYYEIVSAEGSNRRASISLFAKKEQEKISFKPSTYSLGQLIAQSDGSFACSLLANDIQTIHKEFESMQSLDLFSGALLAVNVTNEVFADPPTDKNKLIDKIPSKASYAPETTSYFLCLKEPSSSSDLFVLLTSKLPRIRSLVWDFVDDRCAAYFHDNSIRIFAHQQKDRQTLSIECVYHIPLPSSSNVFYDFVSNGLFVSSFYGNIFYSFESNDNSQSNSIEDASPLISSILTIL